MNSFMNIKLWIVYSQTYFDVSEDELGCWQLRWRQTNLPTSHPRQPSTDPSQDWLRTCKEEGTGQEESRGRGRKYFLLELSTKFSLYLEKAFSLPALSDIRINLDTMIPPGFWILVCKLNHRWAVCSMSRKKFAKFRWQLYFLPTPAQKSAPLLNI